jgi:hypothetical protein
VIVVLFLLIVAITFVAFPVVAIFLVPVFALAWWSLRRERKRKIAALNARGATFDARAVELNERAAGINARFAEQPDDPGVHAEAARHRADQAALAAERADHAHRIVAAGLRVVRP